MCIRDSYFFDVEVLGSSNKELWGDKLKDKVDGGYDIVVDLNTQGMKCLHKI